MRLYPWLSAALALTLIAGATPPLRAQEADTNNVITVNLNEGPPADLLSPEEVERIARSITIATPPVPLTPISPDDQVMLVGSNTLGVAFMNIQDGSLQPLDIEGVFGQYFPLGFLGGLLAWRDGRTLVTIGVDASEAAMQLPTASYVLLTLDRESYEVTASPIDIWPTEFPAVISPLGNKLLLIRDESAPPDAAVGSVRVPIAGPQPVLRAAPRPLPALEARADALQQRWPALGRVRSFQAEHGVLQVNESLLSLVVLDTVSGARVDLTTVNPGTVQPLSASFAPDGLRMALGLTGVLEFDAETRGFFDGSLLSDQIYRDATGQLPPSENPLLQNNVLDVFDTNSGARTSLRQAEVEPDGGPVLMPQAWAPDGKTLLVRALHPNRLAGREHPIYNFQFNERTSYRFYTPELAETGRLESIELSAAGAAFGANNALFVGPDEVIFTALINTDVHPIYYNRATGEFRNIADRAGSYGYVLGFPLIAASSQGARQLVFPFSSFSAAPDLYRVGWDGSGFTRLTWTNAELEQSLAVRQDPVSFTLASGEVREGVLLQPAGASFPPQDAPLIVWQEGGPGVPITNQWLGIVESPFTLLPNFGFTVLVMPLAGRPGLGPAGYSKLYDADNYGAADVDEAAEIARQIIGAGWTSPSKLGVTGCSYGGYFTWQSVIRHPDLYAAANPQCALVDAIVEWSRGFPFLMAYIQGETPFAAPEEYQRDSPIYNASQVRAAVLSFHGTQDFLPVTLNENMHLQVTANGVPTRMVKFVDAGHGLVQFSEYEIYAAQQQIQWFREHLR
jgi:dipeptidyl aminopeptidase/acylaminoacyl peptidase